MQQELLGIIYKILSMLGYSVAAILHKGVIHSLNTFPIFFLSALSCLIFTAVLIKLRKKESILALTKSLDKTYFLISIMNFIGVCSAIYAIKALDITVAISIGYLTPVLTSIFAILILKENFSFKAILALSISILGAIIATKSIITNLTTTLGALSAVVSAVAWSIHNLILKTQSMRDHWTKQLFLTLICTSLISLPFAIATWTKLSLEQVLMFILLAILYTFSKMFLVKGLHRTPLLWLVPISFMKLTFNAGLAYLLFQEVLKANTIIGSALIILATVIVMLSTNRIKSLAPQKV